MCVRKVMLREYERITYHLLPKLSIHLLYSHTYKKKNKEQAKRVSVLLHTRQEERREGGNNERMKHVKIEHYHLD